MKVLINVLADVFEVHAIPFEISEVSRKARIRTFITSHLFFFVQKHVRELLNVRE